MGSLSRPGTIMLGVAVAALLGVVVLWESASPRPPPASAPCEHGLVHASTRAQAVEVGRLLDRLVPKVVDQLESAHDGDLEVWVVEDMPASLRDESHSLMGATFPDGRIVLRESVDTSLEIVLAHELVHRLAGPTWKALPSVAFEGLAETVASLVSSDRSSHRRLLSAALFLPGAGFEVVARSPEGERSVRVSREGELSGDMVGLLGFTGGLLEVIDGGDVDADVAYAFGTFVVDGIRQQHGLTELHRRCRRVAEAGDGSVTGAELLALAGLDEDVSTWWPVLAARLGEEHLLLFALDNAAFLADSVVALAGPGSSVASRLELLTSERVGLRAVGGRAELSLASAPEVLAVLEASWR
jgi:hypothetical protein